MRKVRSFFFLSIFAFIVVFNCTFVHAQYGEKNSINMKFQYRDTNKNLYNIYEPGISASKLSLEYLDIKNNHRNEIYIIVSIFTVIIVFFIINILKGKKLEKKLSEHERQLQKNLNFLRTLLDAIPNPIYCKNLQGQYTECNVHYEKFVGFKRNEIINRTVFDFNLGELATLYHLEDVKLMKNGGTQVYESKAEFSDGTNRDVLFSKAAITDNNNEIDGIVGVMIDITERKKTEERIRRLSNIKEVMLMLNQSIIDMENIEELLNLILEKAIESIDGAEYGSILRLTKDKKLVIAASKGYDEEKIKKFCIPLEESCQWINAKGNIENVIIIHDVDKLKDFKIIKGEDKSIKSIMSTPIIIDSQLYGMLNIDSDKRETFTKRDLEIMEYMKNKIEISISKHKLYKETIYLSRYDKLTDIYNRRHFENILRSKLKKTEEFRVAVFDLNRLKFVNDNYGHLIGDEYIKTFVRGLKKIAGPSDVIARFGGDEFIGIFYDDADTLKNKFEGLLEEMKNNPINLKENRIPCSFSYGISSYPENSTSYETLIKIADDRMYRYKKKTKENRDSK